MKLPWFKRIGILFIPVSAAGWIILVAAFALAVYLFLEIDSRSHSASDTIRPFIIDLIIIYVVYTLIGYLASIKKKDHQ